MVLLLRFGVFAAVALVLGLGSAWLGVTHGSSLVVTSAGPWRAWTQAGRPDADPYTKARMARGGLLPIVSGSAVEFVATADSDGDTLSSACIYEVAVQPIQALWWSIAIADGDGQRIANVAQRYAYNSQNLAVMPDGALRIAIGQAPQPGNWLPSGDAGALRLTLTMFRPLGLDRDGTIREEIMPRISRVDC